MLITEGSGPSTSAACSPSLSLTLSQFLPKLAHSFLVISVNVRLGNGHVPYGSGSVGGKGHRSDGGSPQDHSEI